VRRDLNATLQMGDAFADSNEAEAWSDENEAISNLRHPFSGSERNRLFLNRAGKQFLDVSGLSGVDSPADGRVSVWWDYDRDGRQDLAVINSSSPLLQVYRNQITPRDTESTHGFIAVRFVGGNRTTHVSEQFSNRNGFGAKVRVKLDSQSLLREHLPSQGLAGQNSSVMLIGIGEHDTVERLDITWPSGRMQSATEIAAGTAVTVYENADDRPADANPEWPPGFSMNLWQRQFEPSPDRPNPSLAASRTRLNPTVILEAAHSDTDAPEVLVVTTMASWCTSCARHQPALNELRDSFSRSDVEVVGFAADPDDPADAVQEFLERYKASYPAIIDPPDELRVLIDRVLAESHASDALPTSIVLSKDGRVISAEGGIPTVSQLRRIMRARQISTESEPKP
jgi:peroxiredoxin